MRTTRNSVVRKGGVQRLLFDGLLLCLEELLLQYFGTLARSFAFRFLQFGKLRLLLWRTVLRVLAHRGPLKVTVQSQPPAGRARQAQYKRLRNCAASHRDSGRPAELILICVNRAKTFGLYYACKLWLPMLQHLNKSLNQLSHWNLQVTTRLSGPQTASCACPSLLAQQRPRVNPPYPCFRMLARPFSVHQCLCLGFTLVHKNSLIIAKTAENVTIN